MIFAQLPVVHAVLFFSPTCGHCQYVITEVLPPLFEQYGDQLHIAGVNVTSSGGQALYQAALEHFGLPAEQRAVPTLILDTILLVGSCEIPDQLPPLIEHYLAQGGIGWPAIPGLVDSRQTRKAMPETASEATAEATAPASVAASISPAPAMMGASGTQSELTATSASESDDFVSKLLRNPIGTTLALLLLAGMLAVTGIVLRRVWRFRNAPGKADLLAGQVSGWYR